jgi:rhodanese-related sulfurtransferase
MTTPPPPGRVAAVTAAAPPLAARHFLAQLAFETDPADLAADLAAGVDGLVVVDARSPEAFEAAHLPGAVSLPHATITEARLATLDPTALHVTYCWGPACNAATKAAANLASLGIPVKVLVGGLAAWRAEGFTVEGTAPQTDEADEPDDETSATRRGPAVACAC